MLACAGDNRGPEPPKEQQQQQRPLSPPQGEEPPKGLSDDDWMELMAMAEAQQPPQQQPHGQRQGSATAQADPVPGELLRQHVRWVYKSLSRKGTACGLRHWLASSS